MIPNLNNIKHRDAEELKAYYYELEYPDRVRFVTEVMQRLPQYKRPCFFNWKSMASKMPEEAKIAIEDVAGCIIFSSDNQ